MPTTEGGFRVSAASCSMQLRSNSRVCHKQNVPSAASKESGETMKHLDPLTVIVVGIILAGWGVAYWLLTLEINKCVVTP